MRARPPQHVFYRDINGHIIELWWFPGERAHFLDLTDRSVSAPVASSDPTSHVVVADGTQHVFYTSVDNQVIELWWRPGELPQVENLTMRSPGAPAALGGTRPASHVYSLDGTPTQHVFYNSIDQHVVELRWFGELPPWRDLLACLPDTPASDPVSHVVATSGTQQVFYTNQDLHIRRLGLRGNDPPEPEDLTVASGGGSGPALGGPISHVVSGGASPSTVRMTRMRPKPLR